MQSKAQQLHKELGYNYNRVSGGLFLVADALTYKSNAFLYDLIEKGVQKLLVLDQVTDAHNAGAIFRTAAFYGVDGIIHSFKGSFGRSPGFFKTASGAAEHVHSITVPKLGHCISKLLEKDDILTLKEKYVLVEMSFFSAPINLYEIIFEIQLKGYKPVLAHPERYIFYHNDFNHFYKLKKAGCLFQLNLLSLTEQYGKSVQKASNKLLKEGLYDFVGTDTHHHHHLELLKKIGTQKNLNNISTLFVNNIKIFR